MELMNFNISGYILYNSRCAYVYLNVEYFEHLF